ncbi:polysaccharide deacetylase [Cohnella sp. CBP 2801]|uniref:Polysaccharide deacetylase n=2 Tax=Cohnella zeiphila TaxID=2761120 RepID=A0A7X0SGI9_9BACL|nr:polysaccharide deacetylase [Cohnella zeiphila]
MAWEKVVGIGMEWGSEGTYSFGICKLLVKRHRGKPIVCRDGTRIERGELIGELHLDNAKVLELTREMSPSRAALLTARQARDDMRCIQAALESHPELVRVRGLTGITLLHRGLLHGLGFELQRLPSRMEERMCAFYLRVLLRFLHPEGGRRVAGNGGKLTPMRLVHSRSSLRRQFAQPQSHTN